LKFVIEAAGLTVAGGKELALDLMTRLAGHTEHQFIFLVPDLLDYKAIGGANIRTLVCARGCGLVHRARLLNREVPRICRQERADALLCLGNFAPWKRVCPTVVLLQNPWIVYVDPVAESRRTLRERLITAYGRRAYRHLGHDVVVITQTPVMKDHLCQGYGVAPAHVKIIPNNFSLAKLGGNPGRAGRPENARQPFTFLCLAHYYAHKNIEILAEAVRRLPQFTSQPAKCVITIAPDQHPRARRLLERLGHPELAGKIVNIGPVAAEMLPQVYQNADALIFPTLLESFSRTYLEALHFGLPILTSDRDFAHYLCQNAALYFDPLDAACVARRMAAVMEDPTLRRTLVAHGERVLAQAPTWDAIAARFVEALERTAGGRRQKAEGSRQKAECGQKKAVGRRQKAVGREPADNIPLPGERVAEGRSRVRGFLSVPAGAAPHEASGLVHREEDSLPPAYSPLPSAFRLLPSAYCLLPSAYCLPPSATVRSLFNQKARGWRHKFGPHGTLSPRLEQFTARLSELCPPPGRILDFGCGTGEIAAALDRRGYQVTACDVAEEMIAVARAYHAGTRVEWVWLAPGGAALPFADTSFDGIVASSVFEYLEDVEGTAAELARVLAPEGVMLLTVPNPDNLVRKVEAWLAPRLADNRPGLFAWAETPHAQTPRREDALATASSRLAPVASSRPGARLFSLPPWLPRLASYSAYLRLSRNRFAAGAWQALLARAGFEALDRADFSPDAWRRKAKAPLVLLAVKKAPAQFEVEETAPAEHCETRI
jgi:glycosyltransferase involved in cell wall biosynthesis/SAM-dependent methyltransferase